MSSVLLDQIKLHTCGRVSCDNIKPFEIVFRCFIVLSFILPPFTNMSILCELQLISLMAATCCLKMQNTAFTDIQNDQIIVISFSLFSIFLSPPTHFPKRIGPVSLYRFMILKLKWMVFKNKFPVKLP